ncbi:MAG: threonine ammonia-lyase, partial [Bacillota bacterium]
MIDRDDVLRARETLQGVVHHTRLDYSQTFSRISGNEVYLKTENTQRTGSFKIRGAYNLISSLGEKERSNGVVAASAGNHAQGVAYAAAEVGIPSTIVMPEGTPISKVSATRGYGAEVVLHGSGYDEAYLRAREIQRESGATFVHAFDDPRIIAGQGTIGPEILEDLTQ